MNCAKPFQASSTNVIYTNSFIHFSIYRQFKMIILLIIGTVCFLILSVFFLLYLVGFGIYGILTGSLTAFIQSHVGNVMALSIFAITQYYAAVFWCRLLGTPGLIIAFILIFYLWKYVLSLWKELQE